MISKKGEIMTLQRTELLTAQDLYGSRAFDGGFGPHPNVESAELAPPANTPEAVVSVGALKGYVHTLREALCESMDLRD